MRISEEAEKLRCTTGRFATRIHESRGGCFNFRTKSFSILIVVDNGLQTGWEHVSASLEHRCPNWEEMAYIKSLFWEDNETVIQFHPKKTEYKNLHPYCLHMWKKVGVDHDLPPSILVSPI